MAPRWIRIFLQIGGIFNLVMGIIFFNNRLLANFFQLALWLEKIIFSRTGALPFPQNPAHLLLIHGFGAGAMILGATLLYSAREPVRFLPFILVDALGRLLFGTMMVIYVFRYSLLFMLLPFAAIELGLAVIYIIVCWKLSER
ncbi:MAG TPA: hypothetical protein VLH08_10390 [Acidobacteriota bacterium]|nr:hypothetical protein [Acidobacteriota bacterium]